MNLDTQEAFLCDLVHSTPDIDMSKCPVHTSNISWLIILSFVIASFIFASGLYVLIKPLNALKKTEPVFTEVDTSLFDEKELTVYDYLKSKGGSAYQSDLVKATGFPKVQMTRILDKMEYNHILERKRRGMTNIVVLI